MLARCFCLALLLAASSGWGQNISLDDARREQLAALVKTNPSVATLFKSVLREADLALAVRPQPIEKIQSEGRLKSDPVRIQTRKSLEDMARVRALGHAFAVTGDTRYAAKTREFALAWARVNQPTGGPIDETNLEPLIVAWDLVRKLSSPGEAAVVDAWLRRVADAEIKSRKEKSATSFNNWNSHRLKIVGLIGFTLGDRELIQYATNGYKLQIAANLKPDGSSFDFHERDALHYHVYTLEPLLALALAARAGGINLYAYQAPSRASLDKGIRFLVPFCTGEKTHAEFVNSKVAFDKKRADSGDKNFSSGRLFEPREGAPVFEAATAFDPAYRALFAKLISKPDSPYATWPLVWNSVRF